jgi:tRNA pseudouridine32 synthase/23S rRNA pseudouridine746 synthase
MSVIVDNFIAPPCLDEIEILWQDEHIVLINKPSGLLSLSGKNPQNLDSVHYRLVKISLAARWCIAWISAHPD